MKLLRISLQGEKEYIALNVGFRKKNHSIEFFPRYVRFEQDGQTPSEQSFIGFYSQNGLYRHDCITPSGEVVGYEDAACIDEKLIVCNKVVKKTEGLKPIPAVFCVDRKGNSSQISELSGKLADLHCKGLTPLGDEFALIRPIFDEIDGKVIENPRILLCRSNGLDKSFDLDLRPEAAFLEAKPNEGIGISAPPVNTPYGQILVYHRITWNEERTERQYWHYPLLIDSERPWIIKAFSDSPIVSSDMFPRSSKCWIGGATYFRNLLYNPSNNSLQTIVTEGDINNYWVEIELSEVLNKMKKASKLTLSQLA